MFELIRELAPHIDELVKKSEKILISLHVGADYDSIGSALGLAEIVKSLGKNVLVFSTQPLNNDLKNNQQYLAGFSEIQICNFSDINLNGFDLFICPDSEQTTRISLSDKISFPLLIPTLVIDHHPENTKFGNINLVIPNGTCTSEIVYRLAKECNWPIPASTATSLFVGLWADTGQFMYPGSTTLETFRTAADLIELGKINFTELIWNLKSTDDRVIRTAGMVLTRAEEKFHKKVLLVNLNFDDLSKLNLDNGYLDSVKEFIVHNLSYTRGPSIIALIYEKGDNWYKVSLRSNNLSDLRDVDKIVRKFENGGGHHRAAGADVKKPYSEVKELVIQAIYQTYPELGQP